MDWNYRTNSILRNQYFVSEHQDKENLHNLINLKRERSNRIQKNASIQEKCKSKLILQKREGNKQWY